MFWISYSVTFVLASAITIALLAIRLALSVVERAFASIAPRNQGQQTKYPRQITTPAEEGREKRGTRDTPRPSR
jgi:hypothetical protein